MAFGNSFFSSKKNLGKNRNRTSGPAFESSAELFERVLVLFFEVAYEPFGKRGAILGETAFFE